jgi:ectoine hydroxylase-related dioxygenase (phytanoyl-CoA dioxygenase family)
MFMLSKDKILEYSNELLEGKGYVVLKGLFSSDEISTAREVIMTYSDGENERATHFQGENTDRNHLQKRVWNLLDKHDIFIKMVENPLLADIVGKFLGKDFCLGSIAANRLLPGGPGQEAHIDYPYWDMYDKDTFPIHVDYRMPLNCQSIIMLDDFTEENGATAVVPGSQKECRYPNQEEFDSKLERLTGKAGDVVLFYGMMWHSAMENNSNNDRTAVLIQYLPKFIKPMEDQKNGVSNAIKEKASPLLNQLLGYKYPYPKLMEEAEASNQEGRN